MAKTRKIVTQDGHHFYVKEEFLHRCPVPEEYFAYDLINQYNLSYYILSFNEMFANKLEDLINE